MNDSLDLRNRILKMRESNNLEVTKQYSTNNDLTSEFETSIKKDNQKEIKSDENTVVEQNKETEIETIKNHSENLVHRRDKIENQNINRIANDNDAQFLMLANKFNEAVEVILELSYKVEKLEKNARQNTNNKKKKVKKSSYFYLKIFVFLMLFPVMILGFFNLPFDLSLMKSVVIDILSSL